MRLYEKYRPRSLSQIIGQPPARLMAKIAYAPFCCSILLDGPPGCGKTASALAMAHDLGCFDEDTWPLIDQPTCGLGWNTGLFKINGAELGIDQAKKLFGESLRYRYGSKSGFNVLVIEELEWLSKQCQVYLKTALETSMPKNVIVIATSNDATQLSKALLQRFKTYHFQGGPCFAEASLSYLAEIWFKETGSRTPPSDMLEWGWDGESYSLRKALDHMADHVSANSVLWSNHAGQ